MRTIRVNMAQLAVVKAPDRIETQALGSCVGIVLYDPYAKVGGLAHAMLPSLSDAKESSRGNLAKFADTSVEALIEKMLKYGASREHINAKLVGGANMFPDIPTEPSRLIGNRNVSAARNALERSGIPVLAEDIGGNMGRSIVLDTATGELLVRTIKCGEKMI